MSEYGTVGINVGPVGRWLRLLLGILVVIIVASDFYPSSHPHTVNFYGLLALSLAAIVTVFTIVHVALGDWLQGRSAWWGTAIFVLPTMFMLIAPEFDPKFQPGHLLGYPELNHPFRLALLLYIGLAFLFQWRDRYGGCEAVSIPNFLVRKNYGSYCIPLLPLDVAEKFIMEKLRGS